MKKVSKIDLTNAMVLNDEFLTTLEYDSKGEEVLNKVSLLKEFNDIVKSIVGKENVKITIQATQVQESTEMEIDEDLDDEE